jgi:ubiquinone/menaquinone biosynthesis C-methylase UbiE
MSLPERVAAPGPGVIDSDPKIRELAERVADAVARKSGSYEYPYLRRGYMMQLREIEAAVLREVIACTGGSLKGRTVLDIGCGAGGWLREFIKWGAAPESLWGLDALEDRLDEARSKCPRGVNLILGDAARLEFFSDRSFDLVMLFQCMSLVLDDEVRMRVAAEALRVLKPGGAILWYDYRYQRPGMCDLLRPIRRRELHRYFPDCEIRLRSVLPLPPVSRCLAEIWPPLWHLFRIIPPLRVCYVGMIARRG